MITLYAKFYSFNGPILIEQNKFYKAQRHIFYWFNLRIYPMESNILKMLKVF